MQESVNGVKNGSECCRASKIILHDSATGMLVSQIISVCLFLYLFHEVLSFFMFGFYVGYWLIGQILNCLMILENISLTVVSIRLIELCDRQLVCVVRSVGEKTFNPEIVMISFIGFTMIALDSLNAQI